MPQALTYYMQKAHYVVWWEKELGCIFSIGPQFKMPHLPYYLLEFLNVCHSTKIATSHGGLGDDLGDHKEGALLADRSTDKLYPTLSWSDSASSMRSLPRWC